MNTSPDLCIPRLLAAKAEETPHAATIMAPGRAPLTYARLYAHMTDTVKKLNGLGLGRSARVAVVLPDGPELAVAFLAASAGATCAVLNPAYRANEFDAYLAELNPNALIVQANDGSAPVAAAQARGLSIIECSPALEEPAGIFSLRGREATLPAAGGFAQPHDVAVVLPTSGTTSRPKIVPLTHANLCASAFNVRASLTLTERDRCLNTMPLFHIHGLVGALLSSLAAGGSVVCTSGFYAPKFFEWMEEFRPTWYTAVPAMHQAILARAKNKGEAGGRSSLRLIRSSSAPLPPKLMTELECLFEAPVIEAYGMTEAAHQIASNPLPPRERKPGSVGLATATEIAVLDEAGRPVPAGETGEIVVRGANLAPGYENDSEATRSAFTYGWFRTGDLGYIDPDGYLFITGRLKEIINRGGEKISPREVDDVLASHLSVAEAVTFPVPHAALGEDIAAAVVLNQHATAREIREFVAARLADFKIPRHLLIVDHIPKGPTGKVRRARLAEQLGLDVADNPATPLEADFVPPRTPLEEKLADIWAQVLGLDRVGRHDHFLHLGGDSVLAAQFVSRAGLSLQVELSLIDLFETPTVAGLAETIQSRLGKGQLFPSLGLAPVSRDRLLPLSYGQQALWFLNQLKPDSPVHNRPSAVRLTGSIDMRALERSIGALVERHEAFRTSFIMREGQPAQVMSAARSASLPMIDLTTTPADQRESEAARLASEEAQKPFDLGREPLLRTTLVRLTEEDHVLLVNMHHIISDGWSSEIFFSELAAFYNAFAGGLPTSLPPLSIQYADFACLQRQWLQGNRLDRLLAYWKRRLRDHLPAIELPTDHPASSNERPRGAHQLLPLAPKLYRAIKARSSQERVTVSMMLLAAFKALLYRYAGQTDLAVGMPVHGRNWTEIEGVVGCFANVLVMRSNLSGDPSFRDLLARVKETSLGAFAHQDLPLAKLAEEWRSERDFRLNPPFQVMFNLRNVPRRNMSFSGLKSSAFPFESGIALCDLSLEVNEAADRPLCVMEYNADLFEESTVTQILNHFACLLGEVAARPERRISNLPLTPGAGSAQE